MDYLEKRTAYGVFPGIPSPRYGLVGCGMQTRQSIFVVGAPILWPEKDAAGDRSVWFCGIVRP